MSGIAGIIHFDGKPVEPGLIEKMTGAMAHRGPDGISHWVKGSVALGQCMLRTTPESLEEHQPLANEQGSLVLVMDGRVDNWEELRTDLLSRGARLRTRADAELVLRAYEFWGFDCLTRIDGDFALVIWDVSRRAAMCARDRIGNKPLNYHWDGTTFSFASDLRALLMLPWVQGKPNLGMLVEFLAAEWYSRDETLWQGISRVMAANRLIVDRTRLHLEQYWAPDPWATLPYKKDQDYVDHYRELLTDSVRRLSRSHHPVAYEVSGGLDSSAVFSVAQHLRRSDRLPTPVIKGYTLAFTSDGEENELEYARQVAKYLGIKIHEIPPSFLPFESYRDRAISERDFPGFPNGSMFTAMRRHASYSGSRAMLTGEWGDAWLQGSRRYYAEAIAEGDFSTIRKCLSLDATLFGKLQSLRWLLRYGLLPLLPAPAQSTLRSARRVIRNGKSAQTAHYWLSPGMRQAIRLRREREASRPSGRVRTDSQKELLGILNMALGTQVMERLERLGSEAGVEMRHPYGTSKLVQFAISTPERLRLRGDRTKYIHVQAMQEMMPPSVLERRTKAVFDVAFRQYLDTMESVITDVLPKKRPDWVSRPGMSKLFEVYKANSKAGWPMWILWSILGCDFVAS